MWPDFDQIRMVSTSVWDPYFAPSQYQFKMKWKQKSNFEGKFSTLKVDVKSTFSLKIEYKKFIQTQNEHFRKVLWAF